MVIMPNMPEAIVRMFHTDLHNAYFHSPCAALLNGVMQ